MNRKTETHTLVARIKQYKIKKSSPLGKDNYVNALFDVSQA